MRKLTVLIDADDTIENLCEVWVSWLNEKYNTTVSPTDIKEWDMTKAFPTIPRSEVFKPLFDEAIWKRVTPLPGAVENIQKLIEDGHKVIIVTASHPDTISNKWHYVVEKYFPYITSHDIIVTSKKQLIKGDVLVDDAPHNLEDGDYFKILFDAPHNQSYDAEAKDMTRVYNWDEIYFVINDIANNYRR